MNLKGTSVLTVGESTHKLHSGSAYALFGQARADKTHGVVSEGEASRSAYPDTASRAADRRGRGARSAWACDGRRGADSAIYFVTRCTLVDLRHERVESVPESYLFMRQCRLSIACRSWFGILKGRMHTRGGCPSSHVCAGDRRQAARTELSIELRARRRFCGGAA